ncbi:hypothetical protein CaldiYA01_19410 [Caldicellulosiruptor diazotrophicus]|uniref:Uncharacterized protein n=1 Tax=Caldicellulosiruptor diazotrophicus TaxID=2806205 RepID=A0ABM7NPF3_9FIRM|nr:hypothetical protein CaldiYA01_19410 [Caldicellulosiruptor diazotrophicus]
MKNGNSRHQSLAMANNTWQWQAQNTLFTFLKRGAQEARQIYLLNLGVFWMPAVAKL